MRNPSFFFALVSLALSVGCGPSLVVFNPGVDGASLSTTLHVHVQAESDGQPIVGASVDVGADAVTTDANGDATLAVSSPTVTLRVSASGFLTERWVGVDHEQAIVGLAAPLASRALTGTITHGSGDAVVSVMTSFSMLRATPTTGSAASCPGGACDAMLTVATRDPGLTVAIVDASSARMLPHVDVSADGRFTLDASSAAASAGLATLSVTLPSAPGLEGVVGVPGRSFAGGVFLFPSFTPTAASLQVPAAEATFGSGRLWYVVRGANADGSGESVILDRNVGTDGVVHLPSSFLAIPTATASGSVGIDVDPEVALYVVEASAGATAERVLVLHPSGSHLDVPIALTGASSVTVRAVDAPITSGAVDLGAVELFATRIATLTL